MSQLTIKLSDKADALIAQLQKEIFNRRRKKVSPAGVIETLVESGAKSQSDKRFATSWSNLIADIEKAAKVADAHGAKPATLSEAEWALVLSHRSRAPKTTAAKQPVAKKAATRKTTATQTSAAKQAAATKTTATKTAATKTAATKTLAKTSNPRKAAVKQAACKTAATTAVSTKRTGSSVARRMAKAVGRLGGAATTSAAAAAPSSNGLLLSATGI